VRIPWLLTVLGVSVLLNIALAAMWFLSMIDRGHWASDVDSTFRYLRAERAQLVSMRAHFCPGNATPDRAALLLWESSTRPPEDMSEPYDKDGLLWLRDAGVKLDSGGRLMGICPYMTWQSLERPNSADLDSAGEACPLEPLC